MALTKPNRDMLEIIEGMHAGSALTIASGAVALTDKAHAIDTESAAASDDLTTLNAGPVPDGAIVLLYAANGARTVVLKHGAGNILMANGLDFALDDAHKSILLRRDGANFRDLVPPPAAGSRRLIEEKTASSSASLDFVTGITADYDEFILTGFLRPETDDQQLGLKFSTDGGSTFATGYHSFGRYGRQNGVQYTESASGGNELLIGADSEAVKIGNLSDEGIWFSLRIVNTPITALPKLMRGKCSYVSADGGMVTGSFGGSYTSGSAVDGFQLAFLNGNISSGTVRLFSIVH